MTETTLTELSSHETERLAHCEAVIRRGLNTYVTVGLAIMEIRDARLYRGSHGTFEEYVRDRLDCSREHAYRLIRAAGVAQSLKDRCDDGRPEPVREGHVRPLAGLDGPDDQAEAWNRAVDKAEGQLPTRAQVEEAVAEVRQSAEPEGEPKPKRGRSEESPPPADERSDDPNELGTPHDIINRARRFFGGDIDLDAASSPSYQTHVRAGAYNTAQGDGLTRSWSGYVWCHPPPGKQQGAWFAKARRELNAGGAALVLFMCSTEHIGRKWFRGVWKYPTLILDERLRFLRPDGVQRDPSEHGTAIVCIHREKGDERTAAEENFIAAFGDLGVVMLPVRDGVAEVV